MASNSLNPTFTSTIVLLMLQVGHWLGLEHVFEKQLENWCDPADPVRLCEECSHFAHSSMLVDAHCTFCCHTERLCR